mgnify:CR=1 FL=1
MPMTAQMPHELRIECETWATELESALDDAERIAFMRRALPRLLENRALFLALFHAIASGASYPETRRPTLFQNEIILYLHEQRLFSLRMLMSGPGEYTPIHDHNAWGVIAPWSGTLGVTTYERLDTGDREGIARIRRKRHRGLRPGDTEDVLPLDQGIHCTGNEGEDILVMLSVYGRPVRRPYVLAFDAENERAYPLYTPRTRKRLLAKELLDGSKHPRRA